MNDAAGGAAPLDLVESGWERSIPLPPLTPALLEQHLAPWPALRDREWTLLGGGLRSLNLRSEDLVLRVGLQGAETLAKERALLEALGERLRVPRVHGASETALLLEHVEHSDLPATHEAGRRAGLAAARIHERRFPQAGFLDDALRVTDPFPTALEGLRGWADGLLAGASGERLGPARAAAVRAQWDAREDELAAVCARPALVHSDFKPTNVKWLPDERDVLVLDWEFAWAGPGLLDVGMMLRWDPPSTFAEGFEAGLREGGAELPDDWARLAELLDLFNLVGFLETATGRRLRDVMRRVDQTLAGGAP